MNIANALHEYLAPYFTDLVEAAPSYGWCGIIITFHDGKPVKIEKNVGISIKPESVKIREEV
ncbi:MAG: hypothetical protein LBQ74_15220 [Prevotella sp.]|jgi:hypothetical protein|nr:hypothetical protein [Prevotella sp.]